MTDRMPDTSAPVRLLWREMSPQRRELALAGFLGFLASFSAVALLGTSAWLIATAAQMPPVLTLTVAAVMVRALALGRAIFRYLERLVGHDAAFRGLTGVRVAVYEQLERLSPTGLRVFGRGDLLARLVADVDSALDLPLRIVLPWAQAILVSAGTVVFVAWILPGTGLLLAIAAVLAIAPVPWLAAWLSARAQRASATARGDMSDAVVRALDATPDIAATGTIDDVVSRVRQLDDRLTRLAQKSAYALGVGAACVVLVQGFAVVGALMITVPAVVDGRVGVVWLAVAALLPLALFEILSTLPGSAISLLSLRASATRLADIARTPTVVPEPEHPVALPAEFSGLHVRAMGARWPGGEGRHALRDITLDVGPAERVAVVGPSGAGKSTLASVLMGFLPYSGAVAMSGVEYSQLDGDDLRTQVGVLTQSAHIFDTTISDNIRLGEPAASDERIDELLAQVKLTDYVAGLPKGRSTTVGSFGAAMSGGERQRLALARLLAANRPFVILDEPTEHLDGPTADALMSTILETTRSQTVVLITHRLAGLENFDRIIVLDDGRVVAQGTHEELMAEGGWYATQWQLESERRDMTELLASLPVGVAVPGPARR